MARATPRVEDGILRLVEGDQTRSLRVGTPAWFAWLAGATAFAFAAPAGGFTARQEAVGHGRGGRYWKASRRVGGRLQRAYLGRSEGLTLTRLEATAATLAGRAGGAPDAPPTNLPASLTSFVGRERELAELRRLLGETRLLTLTGPGGVGKTRLALEVARAVQANYLDGVWLVELAPLADAVLVPQVVAQTLAVPEQPGRPLTETLIGWLTSKRLLLLLDNCEHLLDAVAQLADTLLRAAPGLVLLVTSREPLGITGETAWRVPSLEVPPPGHRPSLVDVLRWAAPQLLVERARAVRPTFTVADREAAAVAEICRRLDGLPLAIELAAARVRMLSVEEIAARLDDCFQLLTGGGRTALPRQQTLRATIDWSHALLTEDERALFRRLAVFAGGWTLAAAEAVCTGGGVEGAALLDLLAQLVDKSLVLADPGPDGTTRYRLLETVRQYAQARLAEAGDAPSTRQRQAHLCLALAEQAEPALAGPAQLTWLARLEAEHDNLRVALAWCLEHAPERGLRLAGSLWPFWRARWHYSEAQGWLKQLLERAPEPSRGRARALVCLGRLACEQGDLATAVARLDAGLAMARALAEARLVVSALRELADVLVNCGDLARAHRLIEEGVSLGRTLDDPTGLASALIVLGRVEKRVGAYRRARATLEEAVALARRVGDRALLGDALGWLGGVVQLGGDLEGARALGEEALAIAEGQGATWTVMRLRWWLAGVALNEGNHARATALFSTGLTLARQRQDTFWQAWHLAAMGRQALLQGDTARATTLLEEGLALYTGMADELGASSARCTLGLVAWRQGDAGRGLALLRASLASRRAMGDQEGITAALEALATVTAETGQAAAAVRWLGAAEAVRQRAETPLPPVERPGHEATVAAARATLGEAAFAAAWAAGRASTLDEAVAEALTVAGTTGDPTVAQAAATTGATPTLPEAVGGLTRREGEILRLIAAGRSNRAIGEALSLSVRTVERHITNLYGKIDAANRADATAFAFRHALV